MNAYGAPAIRGRHLLVFVAVSVLVGLAGGYLIRPVLAGGSLMTILALFFAVGLLGVAVAVAPLGLAALPALGFRRVGWHPIVFGTLGTAALSVAVSQLGIEPQGMKQAMKFGREPAQLFASFLVLAVLAPLVEELVFRGLLYGWLESRWNSWVAFALSSLAFAAAHYEPAHILLVLPLGLLFGWLRRRSDSLVPSLVAHAANNGLAVVAAAFFAS